MNTTIDSQTSKSNIEENMKPYKNRQVTIIQYQKQKLSSKPKTIHVKTNITDEDAESS